MLDSIVGFVHVARSFKMLIPKKEKRYIFFGSHERAYLKMLYAPV